MRVCPHVCLRLGPRWLPEVEFHSLLFHYSYKATARLQSAALQKRIFPSNFPSFSLTPSSFSPSSVFTIDTYRNKSTINFISLQLYKLDCVCVGPQLYTKFIHFGFLNHSYAIIKSFVLKETRKETPYFARFAIIGIGGKSPQSAQTKRLISSH